MVTPKVAELAHPFDQFRRELFVFGVKFIGDRHRLVESERSGDGLHSLAFVGQQMIVNRRLKYRVYERVRACSPHKNEPAAVVGATINSITCPSGSCTQHRPKSALVSKTSSPRLVKKSTVV